MPNPLDNIHAKGLRKLLKDILKPTIGKIICAACAALKICTENDEVIGNWCAGTVCTFCGLLGIKVGAEFYAKSYRAFKTALMSKY